MAGIKDKVVVITGASSGIGEAAAVMLAERGAKVVLGARGLDRLESRAICAGRFSIRACQSATSTILISARVA